MSHELFGAMVANDAFNSIELDGPFRGIYICTYVYIYNDMYIYIWYPPPKDLPKSMLQTLNLADLWGGGGICPEVCWQNLGSRLKPIEPIEISIGARIQDPRSKIAQGSSLGILDLGSEPRLKFQSVQSVSIGIQDSANRPLDRGVHCKVI